MLHSSIGIVNWSYSRIAIAAFLTLVACTGTNQTILAGQQGREFAIVDEKNAIRLSAGALDLGSVALRDFKSRNKNWKCFDVLMYSEDDSWRVDFVPSDNVQDEGEVLMVGVSKCGGGISYIVSQAGNIARIIYSR